VGFIHQVDLSILEAFNTLARRSFAFDQFVAIVVENTLVKSGVLIGLLWYFWFSSARRDENRPRVVRIILGACIAIIVGRASQTLLPGQLRPLHDPAVHFRVPYGVDADALTGWSSFPSDHAVLFFAVATGVWAISQRFGILAFMWVSAVIGAARVYAGFHYPFDILGGAVLGFGIMSVVLRESTITPRIVDRVLAMESRRPALFYSAAFVLSWQAAQLFEESRHLVMTLWRIARYIMFGIRF